MSIAAEHLPLPRRDGNEKINCRHRGSGICSAAMDISDIHYILVY
jgi:hypothetical protein